MSLGTKLFLWLASPLVLLLMLAAYADERENRIRLREELAREGRAISRTVQLAIEDALRDRQLSDIRDLVDEISGYEKVLGVRLFDAKGNVSYQAASLDSFPFALRDDLEGVFDSRQAIESNRRIGANPAMSFIRPLLGVDGSLQGAVQVIQLESYIEEDVRATRRSIAGLTAALICATAIILSLGTRYTVSRPIERLMTGVREVGRRGTARRVEADGSDELARLATEFNAMCERLDAARASLLLEQGERLRVEADLRKMEHLASVGRLAAGLAHEIGTPLNVIAGRSELLLRRLPEEKVAAENLRIVMAQVDRISAIVRRMLDFAKAQELNLAPVDLAHLLERVREYLAVRFEENGVDCTLLLPPNLPAVRGDADRLIDVFLNLAVNAVDAMPEGGDLTIHATVEERVPPGRDTGRASVVVRFIDTGCGIDASALERIFDPFYTTKEVGKGTGLGLSVSYGVVREHDGWFEVRSAIGEGTTMSVVLPLEPSGPRVPVGEAA